MIIDSKGVYGYVSIVHEWALGFALELQAEIVEGGVQHGSLARI